MSGPDGVAEERGAGLRGGVAGVCGAEGPWVLLRRGCVSVVCLVCVVWCRVLCSRM